MNNNNNHINNINNNNKTTQIATLANGCFWCTEAIFKRLKGVKSVLPGYSGGVVENASFDVFWHTHDPTTLNRQGNDVGTQYRSAIFYHDQKQKELAEKSKRDLEKAGVYKNPIVTEITPFKNFYVAEEYHKDYYEKHQDAPYCSFVINPKVHKLIQKYGNDLEDRYK
jgi:peptide-methionine (S)-S-oxide reductase